MDYPEPGTKVRWLPHVKKAVLDALDNGEISLEDAKKWWNVSLEEIQSWIRTGTRASGYVRTGRYGW